MVYQWKCKLTVFSVVYYPSDQHYASWVFSFRWEFDPCIKIAAGVDLGDEKWTSQQYTFFIRVTYVHPHIGIFISQSVSTGSSQKAEGPSLASADVCRAKVCYCIASLRHSYRIAVRSEKYPIILYVYTTKRKNNQAAFFSSFFFKLKPSKRNANDINIILYTFSGVRHARGMKRTVCGIFVFEN